MTILFQDESRNYSRLSVSSMFGPSCCGVKTSSKHSLSYQGQASPELQAEALNSPDLCPAAAGCVLLRFGKEL